MKHDTVLMMPKLRVDRFPDISLDQYIRVLDVRISLYQFLTA
jgi:hypothetical protein